MPIGIKITDVHLLTSHEIACLNKYLTEASATRPHDDVSSETALCPELESTIEVAKKSRKKRKIDPMHGVLISESAVNPIGFPPREPKPGQLYEVDFIDSDGTKTAILQEQADGTLNRLSDIEATPSCGDVTYDTLIAYVLEITRTKKVDFADVMKTVSEFNVLNLQALEQLPHLISPVYYKIKERVSEQ